MSTTSRRQFAATIGGAMASLAFGTGCDADERVAQTRDGRLALRPRAGGKTTARGRSALGLGGTRDGVIQMPPVIPDGPMPLVVLLHGAGGRADRLLDRFGEAPGDAGVAVMSLDSRGPTWDGIGGVFGPDVAFLDRALERTFDEIAVDPARLAIAGFSDGASYALSLGLINGDLFRRIAAFSPGFVLDGEPHGRPGVFVSHGRSDPILPIDRCSRVIVPRLRDRGYQVTFREFDGGHQVVGDIAVEAMQWIAAI